MSSDYDEHFDRIFKKQDERRDQDKFLTQLRESTAADREGTLEEDDEVSDFGEHILFIKGLRDDDDEADEAPSSLEDFVRVNDGMGGDDDDDDDEDRPAMTFSQFEKQNLGGDPDEDDDGYSRFVEYVEKPAAKRPAIIEANY